MMIDSIQIIVVQLKLSIVYYYYYYLYNVCIHAYVHTCIFTYYYCFQYSNNNNNLFYYYKIQIQNKTNKKQYILQKLMKMKNNNNNNYNNNNTDPYYVLTMVREYKRNLKSVENLGNKKSVTHRLEHSLPKIKTAINKIQLGGEVEEPSDKQLLSSQQQLMASMSKRSPLKKLKKSLKSKTKANHLHLRKTNYEQSEKYNQAQSANLKLFEKALSTIPTQSKFRNKTNMSNLVTLLQQTNPFFKNCSEILISSFLKVAHIRCYERGEKIYSINDKLQSIFIILYGSIKLTDLTEYKEICSQGETLSEQALFNPNCKIRLENAKSLLKTCLLQIPLYLYQIIFSQLILFGLKPEFLSLQNTMRRNYLLKKSLKTF